MKIACIDSTPQRRLALLNLIEFAFAVSRDAVGSFENISLVPLAVEEVEGSSNPDLSILGPGLSRAEVSRVCTALQRRFSSFRTPRAGSATILVVDSPSTREAYQAASSYGEIFSAASSQALVRRIVEISNQLKTAEAQSAATQSARFSGSDSDPSLLPALVQPRTVQTRGSREVREYGRIDQVSNARTRQLHGSKKIHSGPKEAVTSANRFINSHPANQPVKLKEFGETCVRGFKRIKELLANSLFEDDPRERSYLVEARSSRRDGSGWHRVHGKSGRPAQLFASSAAALNRNKGHENVLPWARQHSGYFAPNLELILATSRY